METKETMGVKIMPCEDPVVEILHSDADFIFVRADHYLKMIQKHPEKIIDATFMPPKIGAKHFGKFRIKLA